MQRSFQHAVKAAISEQSGSGVAAFVLYKIYSTKEIARKYTRTYYKEICCESATKELIKIVQIAK